MGEVFLNIKIMRKSQGKPISTFNPQKHLKLFKKSNEKAKHKLENYLYPMCCEVLIIPNLE